MRVVVQLAEVVVHLRRRPVVRGSPQDGVDARAPPLGVGFVLAGGIRGGSVTGVVLVAEVAVASLRRMLVLVFKAKGMAELVQDHSPPIGGSAAVESLEVQRSLSRSRYRAVDAVGSDQGPITLLIEGNTDVGTVVRIGGGPLPMPARLGVPSEVQLDVSVTGPVGLGLRNLPSQPRV